MIFNAISSQINKLVLQEDPPEFSPFYFPIYSDFLNKGLDQSVTELAYTQTGGCSIIDSEGVIRPLDSGVALIDGAASDNTNLIVDPYEPLDQTVTVVDATRYYLSVGEGSATATGKGTATPNNPLIFVSTGITQDLTFSSAKNTKLETFEITAIAESGKELGYPPLTTSTNLVVESYEPSDQTATVADATQYTLSVNEGNAKIGNAAVFDGSSYINCGNVAKLRNITGFTAKVVRHSGSGNREIFSQCNTISEELRFRTFLENTSEIAVLISRDGSLNPSSYKYYRTIGATPQNFDLDVDFTGANIVIKIDGVTQTVTEVNNPSFTELHETSTDICLGCIRQINPTEFFVGGIGSVKAYALGTTVLDFNPSKYDDLEDHSDDPATLINTGVTLERDGLDSTATPNNPLTFTTFSTKEDLWFTDAKQVNLEAGTEATRWIPTESAPVTRPATVLTYPASTINVAEYTKKFTTKRFLNKEQYVFDVGLVYMKFTASNELEFSLDGGVNKATFVVSEEDNEIVLRCIGLLYIIDINGITKFNSQLSLTPTLSGNVTIGAKIDNTLQIKYIKEIIIEDEV